MKGGINIEIKIVGANSKNGMKLKREVKKSLDDIEVNVDFICLDDEKAKKKYGIHNIPALIVNGKVESEGKVLTSREISKIIINSYS